MLCRKPLGASEPTGLSFPDIIGKDPAFDSGRLRPFGEEFGVFPSSEPSSDLILRSVCTEFIDILRLRLRAKAMSMSSEVCAFA